MQQKHRIAKHVHPSAKILPYPEQPATKLPRLESATILYHPTLYGRRFRTEYRAMPDGAAQLLRVNADGEITERFLVYPSQIASLVSFLTDPPAFGLAHA